MVDGKYLVDERVIDLLFPSDKVVFVYSQSRSNISEKRKIVDCSSDIRWITERNSEVCSYYSFHSIIDPLIRCNNEVLMDSKNDSWQGVTSIGTQQVDNLLFVESVDDKGADKKTMESHL